jgi:hypothetical protein
MVVSLLVNIIFWLRCIDYVNDSKPMTRRKYWREHNNFSIKNSKYIVNKSFIYVCSGAGHNYIFINVYEITQTRENYRLLTNSTWLEENVVAT